MSRVYRYSLIRFLPDPARGEFVNLGVVVMSTKGGELVAQCSDAAIARAIDFFKLVKPSYLSDLKVTVLSEVSRVNQLMQQSTDDKRQLLWNDLIRAREGVLCFSESRSVMSETTTLVLNDLIREYVNPLVTG
jgi:hypothetical protein